LEEAEEEEEEVGVEVEVEVEEGSSSLITLKTFLSPSGPDAAFGSEG
jgi:hypothetical protein